MEKPLVIANWKMKLSSAEAVSLAKKIKKAGAKYAGTEIILCPSFTELAEVGREINDSKLLLGAQDCFWEETGAFTGEVSPSVLKEYGVTHVIVGHSERREHVKETYEMIHKKVRMLLSLHIVPVLCIGETFEERQEGQKDVIIARQLHQALDGLWFNKMDSMVVAYEPVWVIGSGQDIDPEEIEHTNQIIIQTLYDLFPDDVISKQIKIIYGGSVDPENAVSYSAQKSVQGFLVGSASLDATQFSAIIANVTKSA
jgi:triosephosphate isomerase (TIM)